HLHELRRRSDAPSAKSAEASHAEAPLGGRSGAFRMVLSDGYLRGIAVFSVLFTFVNSNGEYMLGRLVKESATLAVAHGAITADKVKEYVGAEYSRFYLFTNIATVALQAFLVSRFIRKFGVRFAFLALPVVPLIDAVGVGLAPLLGLLFAGKILENSLDYSLNNTLRNMLWLPTTREMKYKAKQAVDTFFVRMGDVTSALFIYVIAGVLGLGVRTLAIFSIAACAVWFFVSRSILNRRDAIAASLPPSAPEKLEDEPAEASSPS
ncbi:MAG TPA: Npt1/Npt2 family nucleotide transporter, partial [Polyangiaceae bacterium]|nr:Npt1/Npt2 family nucleotide transporter [Polyangiaceae bacterium]